MLNIFICENDDAQRAVLVENVEAGIRRVSIEAKVALETADPDEVLAYVQENSVTGLYFFDVDLKVDMSGIELASQIRKHDKRGVIAFVTSRVEMMALTFEQNVEAIAYIIKLDPMLVKQQMEKCIKLAGERLLCSEDAVLSFKDGWKTFTERIESINFFQKDENNTHKVVMYSLEQTRAFYGSLNEIETMNSSFFRCHRKTIVNLSNIDKIEQSGIIVMKNGDTCEGSTRKIKELMTVLGLN